MFVLTKSLVFIDLDGFKSINDLYGHNKGDEVLRDFAQTIKKMLRERDVIVRLAAMNLFHYQIKLQC
ncbi:diguanylate cyclase [Photobacterium kishitanii]|uniref:diguanylate cyclase n=1 Tax=Photobacterium kishitanii TaxID=318456 RepID=UPI00273938F1|nr:diguanylate cyclase [Photobacterium kishitanii]